MAKKKPLPNPDEPEKPRVHKELEGFNIEINSFGEIVIPTEKVAESKSGVKRIFERKLFPGYIMVQMKLKPQNI